MRFRQWKRAGYVLAAMLVVPGMSLATAVRTCTPGPPTEASYTWNFPKEATSLLNIVKADARHVQDQAQQLEDYSKDPLMSWQADADKLTQIKQSVNDMGDKLCRLETIRRVTLPWQQDAIDRSARLVRLMADNTQDAIRYLDNSREHLWSPTFDKYATNLATMSSQLSNSVGELEQYAQVQAKKTQLEKNLGGQVGS